MKDATTIISEVRQLAHDVCSFHDRSMCAAISMNLHGFKRYHRYESKKIHCLYLHLANDIGNHAGEFESKGEQAALAAPPGIREHIDGSIVFFSAKMAALSDLNSQILASIGVPVPNAEALQQRIFRTLAKIRRWKQRFEDNKWLPHDIYVFDSHLHDKIKAKEQD